MKKENPIQLERTSPQRVLDILAKLSIGASEKSPQILTITDLQKQIIENGGPELALQSLKDIVKIHTAGLDVAKRGDTIKITGEVYSPGYRPGDTRYGTNLVGHSKTNSRGGGRKHSHQHRGTYRG